VLRTLLAAATLTLACGAMGREAPLPVVATPLQPTKAWSYAAELDETSGGLVMYASVTSRNSVLLPLPQSEPNHGRLVVRHHPKYGFDVYVHVDEGRFLCNNYPGCNLSIQFDDTRPLLVSGTMSLDDRRDVVFIQNVGLFLKSARKAKRIVVSVPSLAGDQVFEFVVDQPLRWPPALDGEGIETETLSHHPGAPEPPPGHGAPQTHQLINPPTSATASSTPSMTACKATRPYVRPANHSVQRFIFAPLS
jgi:hypothetical protein